MSKLDPNLLLILLAVAGGGYFYFKMGGKQMLENLTSGGAADTGDPDEDVPPAKDAPKEDAIPEPNEPDAEEEWHDQTINNIYVIHVDGWMWVNGQRMYPPDDPMWLRYYNMDKRNYRRRSCKGKYRNSRWCKDKERFCSGQWKNTPWCRGFKRGDGHHHGPPPIIVKPPRTPPVGHGPPDHGGVHNPPSPPPVPSCPLSIQKNGKTYRLTHDPMPDVMPAIFPPPYVKQGNCVYKLDNNQGQGQDGRGGWDGHRGGFGISIGGDDGINIGSFYTYSRIGNV